jgi:ATP-dependent Clp protease ATP-binding subunit ClpX
MDTKDILFICGGAFIDLEKTVSERQHDASIGFGASVRTNMSTSGLSSAAVTSSLLESVRNLSSCGSLNCMLVFRVYFTVN